MCSVETRFTETREQTGQRTASADGVAARSEQRERRRKHRPRALLRVAEEAPRPLARLDAPRRHFRQLVGDGVERDVIRLRNVPGGQPEGRPVEVVVGDEADVLLAAAALELHAEDRRVRRAGQPDELPERRRA